FNARGEHPKGCVRLKNACNLASCNKSCEDAGGGICISKDVCCCWRETTAEYFRYSKMKLQKFLGRLIEMKKIIMVIFVVLQAAAEGAHFNAGGAHFNARREHPKGCVRLKNACNLASCNKSCEDAGGGICISKDAKTTSKYFRYSKMERKKIIMVVLVILQAATERAHFNAGGAHFNAGGAHQKGYVRLKNACNLASCNRSCEDAGGGICISKDVCCCWA
nr:hypothetical protein [Tanacetum cinerariifolium]